VFAFVLVVSSTVPLPVRAQDESEPARKTPSPNNINFDVGAKDDVRYVVDTEPDAPLRLTDRWNLMTRTMPALIYQLESSSEATLRLHGERIQADDVDRAAARNESGSVVRPVADEPVEVEANDPWERVNGKTFEFNRHMDKYALKPIAKTWKTVVPQPAQIMIANAFDNLNVVPNVVNNLLQKNWNGAGRGLTRFLINSTAGIGGLYDPAKEVWHIAASPADFGQTLGKWGTGPGPYVVLPFMEPLTVRDGIGKLIDRAMDPLSYVMPLIPALSLTAGKRINERALNYELFAEFDEGVIDAYTAVRDGYLQRRGRMLHE
jgi:phospholipid-binding lipoprotein MlaA